MSNAITTIGPLKRALALATEAGDIDALRDVAATAAALQKGAKARGMGIEAENMAAEVIIRAERAIGKALPDPRAVMSERAATRASAGNQHGKTRDREGLTSGQPLLPTADELGFDLKAAWRFRALASIPESDFEELFATVKASGVRIAKQDFYRLVKGIGKVPDASVRRVKALFDDGEEPIAPFVAWMEASRALIVELLPDEELAELAGMIRTLVLAYTNERARRTDARL